MKYTGLTLLFILLYSCGPNNRENKDTSEENISENTDTLSYVYEEVKETSSYLIGTEDDLDTTYYHISYPVFSNERFNQLVHPAIFIDGERDPHEAAQAFIDGFNEFVEEVSTTQVSAPWVKDVQSKVVLHTPRLLSLCTKYYEYTGGAHGNTVALWANFDISEMQEIKLTDIVPEENLPELTKIAEKHFRTVENLSDTASLIKDFFFMDGIFALNDNFGLTDNGLTFYYNEYEIKPYVKGSTTIQIPYTEIEAILSSQGRQYINSIRRD